MNLAAVIVIFGIVGISLVVLTGWAGQVSLGPDGVRRPSAPPSAAASPTASAGTSALALLVGGVAGAVVAVSSATRRCGAAASPSR